MGEVLSQNEIDALLSAIRSGEVVPDDKDGQQVRSRPVRTYDFRRPNRFSKDQLRTISMIHGIFARLAAMTLSVQLRFPVNVSVRSLDQVTYDEFIRSIPQPAVLMLLGLGPLEGKALLEINNALALLMVDRLLGGAGQPGHVIRSITEVERLLIERMGEKILPAFREAWHSIIEITPALVGIETNPQFAQIASPGDAVLLIALEVRTPNLTSAVTLCLPYLQLQPILGRLSATTLFRAASHKPGDGLIRSALEESTVTLRALLGSARVSLGELLELARDDVVRLDRPTEALLDVLVGDQAVYKGRPGRVRRRLAVEIATCEGTP